MNTGLSRAIQYLVFLSAGIVLCWFFFRDFDFGDMKQRLEHGNISWFIPVIIVSFAVYLIRVLRWQMLIRASGHHAGFMSALSALSLGYFVNFFFPRLGEVVRCVLLQRQDKVPFMQSLGTVIIERVTDVISLALVLLLTLIFQFHHIIEFMKENIFAPVYHGVIEKMIAGNTRILLAAFVILALSCTLIYLFRRYIRERSPRIITKFVEGLKDGLASILRLRNKWLFILYTVLIWVCYYFMTWFWFYVFDETSGLGWGACLAIVSIGTIGRSVPVQGGGMGAYHYLVTSVVVLYGISENFGKTLAVLIHAGQTLFTFAMGLVGLIIFSVLYWKNRSVVS